MVIKKLLNNNVLVEVVEEKESLTSSGLIIKSSESSCKKVKIAQLPDEVDNYSVGDVALIPRYSGVLVNINDKEFLIINIQEIILVF